MMFDDYCIKQIISGKKTVTRRLRNDDNRPAVPGNIHKLKKDRTNRTYGYIKIMSCEKYVFGNLTTQDDKKEGFNSITEYEEYFLQVNGSVRKDLKIWVIEFEYLGKTMTLILDMIHKVMNR